MRDEKRGERKEEGKRRERKKGGGRDGKSRRGK